MCLPRHQMSNYIILFYNICFLSVVIIIEGPFLIIKIEFINNKKTTTTTTVAITPRITVLHVQSLSLSCHRHHLVGSSLSRSSSFDRMITVKIILNWLDHHCQNCHHLVGWSLSTFRRSLSALSVCIFVQFSPPSSHLAALLMVNKTIINIRQGHLNIGCWLHEIYPFLPALTSEIFTDWELIFL